MQREDILAEIRRTARENGGKPLGRERFERITGIKPYDWAKYWARFGDAQKEAGFKPNTLMAAYDEVHLLDKLAELTQELGKFPTHAERRMKSFNDSSFPNVGTFQRMGNKHEVLGKLLAYCSSQSKYADVIQILKGELAETFSTSGAKDSVANEDAPYGSVYLFKSGRYYKIGMTKDTVRRGSELRIQLPERMDLIHVIQTDDPSGIEAYWHKRFEAKRMNGEWFNLTPADVRAFKRWRKIF
ncbi:MAG TPA: GIY-YIG nuclease family protein [Candidatus Saccharimonadales bacterium]|nr:GIY-YIG nuclease family protein [Candidatus Saccharimonadales bacterium]